MKTLLFSAQGRVSRSQYWLAVLMAFAIAIAIGLVGVVLAMVMPGAQMSDGQFNAQGPAAVPFILLFLVYMVVMTWIGICISIKRCHDRDRSGWFILIQLVPIVGGIWFFVETGCLRGTVGPNIYGPDPVGGAVAYAAAV